MAFADDTLDIIYWEELSLIGKKTTLKLLSANAVNLDEANILSSGKGLSESLDSMSVLKV